MTGCGIRQVQHAPARLDLDDAAFVTYLEGKVKDTIDTYDLLSGSKKIAVAVSGGKDSTTILHILLKLGYPVEAVTVDAKIGCYTATNLENIRTYCKAHNVPLHEINFREEFGSSLCYLQSVLKAKGIDLKSCTTCGVLRRTLLNKKVRDIGADILVTGHNLDDEAQVFVMNLMKNTLELSARMGPRTGVRHVEGLIPRVKPLYFIKNNEVVRYSKIQKFPVYLGECPCSVEGQRSHIKHWLNDKEAENPDIKENIIRYFLDHKETIITQHTNISIPHACARCDEPCAGEICKACQILDKLSLPIKNTEDAVKAEA